MALTSSFTATALAVLCYSTDANWQQAAIYIYYHKKAGETIATTRLIPLHATKKKSIARSLSDSLDYGKNPAKTDNGQLVSSYECDPQFSADQFLMKKQIYEQITGRTERNSARNIIAYQIRQSFAPDDNITPEQANKLGMELAQRFAGDDFQILVCTHIDTDNIHNHIYFNSTNLDCSSKFINETGSAFKVQELSDEICRANGLSVVEKKAGIATDYGEWLEKQKGVDWKAVYKEVIDSVLPHCSSLADFKQQLKKLGYSVRGKKSLSIKHPDQSRGMKIQRIDPKLDYSPTGIEYAIKHGGHILPKTKKIDLVDGDKVNLIMELEGKTGGLKVWAEKKNFKEITKAYKYLKTHGLVDMAGLTARMGVATQEFNTAGDKIKEIETSLDQSKTLKIHIINYARTVDIYKSYKSSRHKDKFYEEHKTDILLHENSTQAFKSLGVRKLPKIAELNAKIESLIMEKTATYSDYKSLRAELKELQIVRRNLESFLTTNVERLKITNQRDL